MTGVAFASGSAVLDAIVTLCPPGGHILCVDDVYGGTRRYLTRIAACHQDKRAEFCRMEDLDALSDLITDRTSTIWIETPTNPTLKLVDIASVVSITNKKNPKTLVVIDNTFATPIFQQPLSFGAHLVVHSLSKYLNGHSDVIGGIVVGRESMLEERLRFLQNALGAVPSPFDCYLVLRGLRTLYVRMQQHAKNAMEVARFLEGHPAVQKVFYPGLESHPQHSLALKQQKGFGGMVSAVLKSHINPSAFCSRLKILTLAESLGAVESLIEIPALMTHVSVAEEARLRLGITNHLVRLSIGIEDVQDLIGDLAQALNFQ